MKNRRIKFKQKKALNRNRGQITIFVIVAIVIVLAIALYFIFQSRIFSNNVPKNLEPVYNYYLSCVQNEVTEGAKLLGARGGRIEEIQFSPGSTYMPFSNELGFMGMGIPYWYYISGNGISREQIPTKEKMQSDLNGFVREGLQNCDFSGFENKGFNITIGEPLEVKNEIKNSLVKVAVKQEISIRFGKVSWSSRTHNVEVNSNLGKFYDLALKIYRSEKESLFLENYAVDIIRLYAPVDGSEISCSPKVWSVNDIRMNLSDALEANTAAIKIAGDYYKIKNRDNKYFIQNVGEKTPFNVNFMYSKYWPTKMEIWPSSDDGILRADPIGLQGGLGILGFCYVPYHFVYDLYYPVLIQIYLGDEMFQYPVVVSIDKTQAKKALNGTSLPDVTSELCEHKLTRMSVYSYNTNLEAVESNIKFKCFDTICDIGKTKIINNEAVLDTNFPQCQNGFVIASSEGYETRKELISTIVEGSVNMIMKKKYKLNLVVHERGSETSGYAIVTLTKENKTTTLSYPEMKEIELTEGQYLIKVYDYSNTSIHLQGTSNQKCVDVPRGNLLGAFGFTEQKCFNMDIPSQEVNFAVSGGGIANYYFPESALQTAKTLLINAEDFGVPNSIEGLQKNYDSIDVANLNIQLED